jgi:hypothetical protein
MLPYCYEQLRLQRAEIESDGEERWLERNLREPEASETTAPARRPLERPVPAVVADPSPSDQRFADG